MGKGYFRLPKDTSVHKIGVMLQATQLLICYPKSKNFEQRNKQNVFIATLLSFLTTYFANFI